MTLEPQLYIGQNIPCDTSELSGGVDRALEAIVEGDDEGVVDRR